LLSVTYFGLLAALECASKVSFTLLNIPVNYYTPQKIVIMRSRNYFAISAVDRKIAKSQNYVVIVKSVAKHAVFKTIFWSFEGFVYACFHTKVQHHAVPENVGE